MKNENHKKVIFFEDFGQFGGVHPTPEVKICLYTKFEVNRSKLGTFQKFQNSDFLGRGAGNISEKGFGMPHGPPGAAQSHLKATQEPPENVPRAPKSAQGPAKSAKMRSRAAKERPKSAPERPKTAPKAPNGAPRAAKRAPRGSQETSRRHKK